MTIEEKLESVDFSKQSKIQNMLLLKLLNKRKMSGSLSMDELDMVVAAGNTTASKIDNNNFIKK